MNIRKLIKTSILVFLVVLPTTIVAADDLQSAYQKEYAYLEDQKRNLLTRIAEFKAKSKAEKLSLENKANQLAREQRKVQEEVKNMNSLVFESERTLEAAKDNKDIFASTFEQAKETLKSYDIDASVPADIASNKKVGILFSNAFSVLEDVSSVSRTKDSFYDIEGKKINGELLHVGQIATFGMSDSVRGILVPAGDGAFKLWQQPAAEVADSLFADEDISQIKMFIYENKFTAINTNIGKGIIDYINSGGMVAWVIILLGMLAVVLIVLRALFLRSASSASENILVGIKDFVA